MFVTLTDLAKINTALGQVAGRLVFVPDVDDDGEQLPHGTLEIPEDLASTIAGLDLAALPAIPRDFYRAECARRIMAHASEATQRNLAGYCALLASKASRTDGEQADLVAFGLSIEWIASMRATWRALADAQDENYTSDEKWPPVPPAAAALAARF